MASHQRKTTLLLTTRITSLSISRCRPSSHSLISPSVEAKDLYSKDLTPPPLVSLPSCVPQVVSIRDSYPTRWDIHTLSYNFFFDADIPVTTCSAQAPDIILHRLNLTRSSSCSPSCRPYSECSSNTWTLPLLSISLPRRHILHPELVFLFTNHRPLTLSYSLIFRPLHTIPNSFTKFCILVEKHSRQWILKCLQTSFFYMCFSWFGFERKDKGCLQNRGDEGSNSLVNA